MAMRASSTLVSEARRLLSDEAMAMAVTSCLEDRQFEELLARVTGESQQQQQQLEQQQQQQQLLPPQQPSDLKPGRHLGVDVGLALTEGGVGGESAVLIPPSLPMGMVEKGECDGLAREDKEDRELEYQATLRCAEIEDSMMRRPAPAHSTARGRASLTELGPSSPAARVDGTLREMAEAAVRHRLLSISVALPAAEAAVPSGSSIDHSRPEPVAVPLGQMLIDGSEIAAPVSLGGAAGEGPRRIGVDGFCPMPLAAMEAAARSTRGHGAISICHKTTEGMPSPSSSRYDLCSGIAICWSHSSCTFFHLPSASDIATAQGEGGETSQHVHSYLGKLWRAVQLLLADPAVSKSLFASRQQLTWLFSMHRAWVRSVINPAQPCPSALRLAGALFDPQAMRWSRMGSAPVSCGGGGSGTIISAAGAADPATAALSSLKAVLSATIADYSLLVPMHANAAVRRACRFALARLDFG